MGRKSKFSPEVHERGVRMVLDSEREHGSRWAATVSIAEKLGCTPETLRKWIVQAERDSGQRAGLTTSERERLKVLERENFELKRANEILRKASAYFAAAELDRRHK
jgi:transposase